MRLAVRLHDLDRAWTTPTGAALVEAVIGERDDADNACLVPLPRGEGVVLRHDREVLDLVAAALVELGVEVYSDPMYADEAVWTRWQPASPERAEGETARPRQGRGGVGRDHLERRDQRPRFSRARPGFQGPAREAGGRRG